MGHSDEHTDATMAHNFFSRNAKTGVLEGRRIEPLSTNHYDRVKLNYKARPLNGIWASAPYLHNGSIPNLDELLKKPHQRSQAVFKVGSRNFDPVKVGFQADRRETFDPQLKGNLNVGHDYGHDDGTPFTDDERKFLIEYMNSL